jgi:hypothetical protein
MVTWWVYFPLQGSAKVSPKVGPKVLVRCPIIRPLCSLTPLILLERRRKRDDSYYGQKVCQKSSVEASSCKGELLYKNKKMAIPSKRATKILKTKRLKHHDSRSTAQPENQLRTLRYCKPCLKSAESWKSLLRSQTQGY